MEVSGTKIDIPCDRIAAKHWAPDPRKPGISGATNSDQLEEATARA